MTAPRQEERPLTQNIRPGEEPLDIEAYLRTGGYTAVRKALSGMTPQEVVCRPSRFSSCWRSVWKVAIAWVRVSSE